MNRFERTGLLERERERFVGLDGFYFLACLASVTSIFLAICWLVIRGGLEISPIGKSILMMATIAARRWEVWYSVW